MKFDARIEECLFSKWVADSNGGFAVMLIVIFVAGFVIELLKYLLSTVVKSSRQEITLRTSHMLSIDTDMAHKQILITRKKNNMEDHAEPKDIDMSFFGFNGILTEATLFLFMKVLNYSFMLVAMSFNLWVILTMCVSLALSNFMFEMIEDRKRISKMIIKFENSFWNINTIEWILE